MSESRVLWEDHGEVLKRYRECRKFFHVLRGPLAGRKTRVSIMKCLNLVCEQTANKQGVRKSRGVIVRNTYPDLTSTTIHDWREAFDELKIGHFTMGHPPLHQLDFDLPDGTRVEAEIMFLALDKPEDVRKLRGLNVTWAYVNEMKEVPWSVIEMLFGRVDRYPLQGYSTYAGVFGDTNSWDSDHDLEKQAELWRKGEKPDFEFLAQPGAVMKKDGKWVVNPDRENKYYVGDEYYERQIQANREDFIKVNLANEIGYFLAGRPVHSSYSDATHGANEELIPCAGMQVYVGADFGLTPAAAFIQRQPDGQWWVFDEIVFKDGDAASLAEAIKARASEWIGRVGLVGGMAQLGFQYRGDPSGDNRSQTNRVTPFQIVRGLDVPMFPASTNDPVLRRAALDKPLERIIKGGKPGILFSTRVPNIRKGLAGAWCYDRVLNVREQYKDTPNKGPYSHICEALEYALIDAGEHAIINAPESTNKRRLMDPRIHQVRKPTWDPLDV